MTEQAWQQVGLAVSDLSLDWIVPDRRSARESFLNHAPFAAKRALQDARPALFERVTAVMPAISREHLQGRRERDS